MVSLALLPGLFVGWCWAKASGLGREGQYEGRLHTRSAPSPACGGGLGWGQVTDDASRKQVTARGITNIRACCVPPPAFASLRHPPPQAQGCPGNDSLCHGACPANPALLDTFRLSRLRKCRACNIVVASLETSSNQSIDGNSGKLWSGTTPMPTINRSRAGIIW